MTDQYDQIRQRIRWLLETRKLSVNRLAAGNTALQRKLQRQINENVSMTLDVVIVLQRAMPGLNAQWLVTGEGHPFVDDDTCRMPADVAMVSAGASNAVNASDDEVIVPVYSVEASANLNTLTVGDLEPEVVGRIVVPNMPRCDGATYVRGDSMYPLLQSGDLIGFKVLPVSRDSIFFGEIYLVTLDVEGDRYLTVKYIYRSALGNDYVQLYSANPNHQPKDVHLSSIKGLALVKFTVRLNSML